MDIPCAFCGTPLVGRKERPDQLEEHVRYHRGFDVKPLWDGRKTGEG